MQLVLFSIVLSSLFLVWERVALQNVITFVVIYFRCSLIKETGTLHTSGANSDVYRAQGGGPQTENDNTQRPMVDKKEFIFPIHRSVVKTITECLCNSNLRLAECNFQSFKQIWTPLSQFSKFRIQKRKEKFQADNLLKFSKFFSVTLRSIHGKRLTLWYLLYRMNLELLGASNNISEIRKGERPTSYRYAEFR